MHTPLDMIWEVSSNFYYMNIFFIDSNHSRMDIEEVNYGDNDESKSNSSDDNVLGKNLEL